MKTDKEIIRNIGSFQCIENGKTTLEEAYNKIISELKSKPLRLILSSFGFESPIVCEKLKKIIPQEDIENKQCFVIPYAQKNVQTTFEITKKELIAFGFSEENIRLTENREDLMFGFPDYIYVPGGDPFLLLKTLKDLNLISPLVECVKEKRATYIGVSAGADILAKNIGYVTQFEDNNVICDNDFSALGLINEGVLCHYNHRSFSLLKTCKEICNTDFVTLNDDQVIEFTDGLWEYAGDEL